MILRNSEVVLLGLFNMRYGSGTFFMPILSLTSDCFSSPKPQTRLLIPRGWLAFKTHAGVDVIPLNTFNSRLKIKTVCEIVLPNFVKKKMFLYSQVIVLEGEKT